MNLWAAKGANLRHSADPEILKGILLLCGRATNFADNLRSYRRLFVKFLKGGMSHQVTSNKLLDFGADPNHEPDPGILVEF